jgi:predicted Fe-S protein YdhL (DUF1289 family)
MFCVGCGRTLAEIGAWTTMNDAARAAVMLRLKDREGFAIPPAPK